MPHRTLFRKPMISDPSSYKLGPNFPLQTPSAMPNKHHTHSRESKFGPPGFMHVMDWYWDSAAEAASLLFTKTGAGVLCAITLARWNLPTLIPQPDGRSFLGEHGMFGTVTRGREQRSLGPYGSNNVTDPVQAMGKKSIPWRWFLCKATHPRFKRALPRLPDF